MKKWVRKMAVFIVIICALLFLVNSSLFAPQPQGEAKLIAHRGVNQMYDLENIGRDDCTATRIIPPMHDFQENTIRSLIKAGELGASMVEVDVSPTADGEMMLFHDWTLDCRTDGSGDVRDANSADLKKLDIAYGYSADGGKTFPFRGQGIGQMPTVAEALEAIPDRGIIFNFKSGNPEEADMLAAILQSKGVKIGPHYGFYGHIGPVERMRTLAPQAWTFATSEARTCTADYVKYGWTGHVPETCRNGTIIIPLNYQWIMWGWPNRFIERMEAAGVRMILFGPYISGMAPAGLTSVGQLNDVPETYNGYIWVENIYEIGPAMQ